MYYEWRVLVIIKSAKSNHHETIQLWTWWWVCSTVNEKAIQGKTQIFLFCKEGMSTKNYRLCSKNLPFTVLLMMISDIGLRDIDRRIEWFTMASIQGKRCSTGICSNRSICTRDNDIIRYWLLAVWMDCNVSLFRWNIQVSIQGSWCVWCVQVLGGLSACRLHSSA